MDYVCYGLAYPDEFVQTALTYICRQLYATHGLYSAMGSHLNKQVAHGVLVILANTQNQRLQMNALGMSPYDNICIKQKQTNKQTNETKQKETLYIKQTKITQEEGNNFKYDGPA